MQCRPNVFDAGPTLCFVFAGLQKESSLVSEKRRQSPIPSHVVLVEDLSVVECSTPQFKKKLNDDVIS